MKNKSIQSLLVATGLLASASVYADHNSVWGEGWANMPNDIHNTRIDTLDGDQSEFTDFVRYGEAADSVNRFATEDSVSSGAGTDVSRQSADRASRASSVDRTRSSATRMARSSVRSVSRTTGMGRR